MEVRLSTFWPRRRVKRRRKVTDGRVEKLGRRAERLRRTGAAGFGRAS